MELLNELVSLIIPLGLLIACLYLVYTVRRAVVQFRKFEKLFRFLREANVRTRFLASRANDKAIQLNNAIQDLLSQIDILLHKDGKTTKTEEKNDDHN